MFGLMEASARRRAVGAGRSSSAAAGRGEGGVEAVDAGLERAVRSSSAPNQRVRWARGWARAGSGSSGRRASPRAFPR